MATVIPVTFVASATFIFLLFGGWSLLPRPWSTVGATVVYSTAAILFIAARRHSPP